MLLSNRFRFIKTFNFNIINRYSTSSSAVYSVRSEEKIPLITCKRKEFNLYVNNPIQDKKKFGEIKLASHSWDHRKSIGDYFIIHPFNQEFNSANDEETFEKFPIAKKLVDNLREMEIEHPTAIQSKTIPSVLSRNHTLCAAETGCGKTLAYLIPIVELMLKKGFQNDTPVFNTPKAVIITPGRELAVQIGHVAEKLTNGMQLKTKVVLGGRTKQQMLNPTFDDIDILVASLGALSKLVTTGIYRMNEVRWVVLDEADTLLDDSFIEKLSHFMRKFPFHKNHLQDMNIRGTQLILAAATMPDNIDELLGQVINTEMLNRVVSTNLHKLLPNVPQRFMRLNKAERPKFLVDIILKDLANKKPVIVFSNKNPTCDFVSLYLNDRDISCVNLNGDMPMNLRIGQFERFQNGEVDVLSTTDVASRGLDTRRAQRVINFDFPLYVADYIHRCGRIGRVGSFKGGLVTNFVSSGREFPIVQRIEHVARTNKVLPNVNANISKIISDRIVRNIKKMEMPVN